MRTSTVSMMRHAQEHGYAVPALNVVDDLSLRAVVAAARRLASPVIVQASVKTARAIGVDLLMRMFEAASAAAGVPIALHLDHCPDEGLIREVVEAGWSSVLFDASSLDYDEAVTRTRRVVDYAHAHGVDVESEIENIVGVEDGVGSDSLVHSYSPERLVEAAEKTGADLLAPQLGTQHGQYTRRPRLLPERVHDIRRLTDRPIVLHGGTGLTGDQFRAFIEAGISKINVSTALKRSYMGSALESLREAEAGDVWDPPVLFRAIETSVEHTVGEHIAMFGAGGWAVDSASACSAGGRMQGRRR